MKKLRLRPIVLTLFVVLTVPVVFLIVAVNYVANEGIARDNATQLVERFRAAAIQNIQDTFAPIRSMVEGAAEVGTAQPGFYSDNRSLPYLLSILRHGDQTVAMYVGEQDGTFRQARVVDLTDDNPGDPPAETAYAYRWIEPGPDDLSVDTSIFIDGERSELARFDRPTSYDPRVRPWYQIAAQAGRPIITDPEVFAVFDLIGFTVAAPYYTEGVLRGVAAADITLDGLSDYLAANKISPGTQTYILDDQGRVIANSEGTQTYAADRGRVELMHVAALEHRLPAIAYGTRPRESEGFYAFDHDGEEYLAALSTLPPDFGKRWQLFVVTPMDDFVGAFERNNMRLLAFGLGALVLQLVIIYYFSGVVSKPLEKLAHKVANIQASRRQDLPQLSSSISEVAVLSRAIDTLDSTVRSFAAFVPWGLVRELIQTDSKLELGGHSRFLTIFFSDLESFSTLSEEMPSRDLLLRVSAYLEIVTHAVNREQGTIDKFMGDGVMAFWGAPAQLDDHAWRSCVAALRIQHDMVDLNRKWVAEGGKALNVRVGIHSDAVLVGNIGSTERMSYTVLGDGVNIAARLEGINKEYGTNVCISHSVFKEAGERLCVRPIEDVAVKGRRTLVTIYELLGVYGSGKELEPDAATVKLAELTREAYATYIGGDVVAALGLYRAILAEYPGDPVATKLIERIEAADALEPVAAPAG